MRAKREDKTWKHMIVLKQIAITVLGIMNKPIVVSVAIANNQKRIQIWWSGHVPWHEHPLPCIHGYMDLSK